MSPKGNKVLLGLTGGIACYKIPYLVRSLRKSGIDVKVIMTENATKFITPLTLETVSKNPVAVEMFPADRFVSTRHIELSSWPDLTVIAPATANIIGKVASGISDDLLTTILCATKGKVLVAPAMNPNMWENKITQRNVAILREELGWEMIGPAEGEMAEDQWGVGRMAEPEEIFDRITSLLRSSAKPAASKKKLLKGKRVLITAGPCREPIDPVRYISNRSSGKMGFALAEAAAQMGAKTTLIAGPHKLDLPRDVSVVSVETTEEMLNAVESHFKRADLLIMAAAPSDYKPARVKTQKIKKKDASLTVELEPTPDILKTVAASKRKDQIVVGFAVETENDLVNAKNKLTSKNLDLIVLNNPTEDGAGFDHDTNRVTVISLDGAVDSWNLMRKESVAVKLLEKIAAML